MDDDVTAAVAHLRNRGDNPVVIAGSWQESVGLVLDALEAELWRYAGLHEAVEMLEKRLLEDGNRDRAAMARAALTLYDGEVGSER